MGKVYETRKTGGSWLKNVNKRTRMEISSSQSEHVIKYAEFTTTLLKLESIREKEVTNIYLR